MRLPSYRVDALTFRQACLLSLIAMATLALLSACTLPDGRAPSTAAELKEFIQQPLPLLVMMLVAGFASAFKQMVVARRGDPSRKIGPISYFTDNWPETLIALGAVVGVWFTLLMTDSLNWAAIGWGYIANDAADSFTTKGRSEMMATGVKPEDMTPKG